MFSLSANRMRFYASHSNLPQFILRHTVISTTKCRHQHPFNVLGVGKQSWSWFVQFSLATWTQNIVVLANCKHVFQFGKLKSLNVADSLFLVHWRLETDVWSIAISVSELSILAVNDRQLVNATVSWYCPTRLRYCISVGRPRKPRIGLSLTLLWLLKR